METTTAKEQQRYTTSPWGKVQCLYTLAPGIYSVSTARHGGIKLDREHNARMPDGMRCRGGWYEEDCDWCLPFVVFQAEIMAGQDNGACRAILAGEHIKTFREWHPSAFEAWFDVELKLGESYIRDKALWDEEHKADYVVFSASGSWHKTVPDGFVGVLAKNPATTDVIRKLIPAQEYSECGRFSFVVAEPDDYQYWPYCIEQ